MICKKCGAQIRKEDRRADGLYVCPGCQAVYRAKAKADAAERAKPDAKPETPRRRAGRGFRFRWTRIAVAAALVAAVAVGLVALLSSGKSADRVAQPEPEATAVAATARATAAPTAVPTPTPLPTASVHFRAVGDVMSHKLQLKLAKQSDGSYNYDSQFMYVKDALSVADYTIANLETSISVNGEYSSYPRFRTPEALLATLQDCGVDMLTMANNHILDGDYPGLVATLDAADRYGFDHVGAYRDAQEAAQPKLVEINGITFGFLAYTVHTNDNEKRLEPSQRVCVKRLDEADFDADVRELREMGAEVVICLPHWGSEGSHAPNAECKRYAKEMVEAGVDIILGSHPHVVQPINMYQVEVDGEQKDVLIAWSMGNFISFMDARYMDCGIIVDFTVTRDEAGKIHIHDVGYVPVYVCGTSNLFHLVCSGDFYNDKPSGMPESEYDRMRQSAREIISTVGQDGITVLQH